MLSFFPRGVLDEILNLIESVSEDFPSYSCISELLCLCRVEILKNLPVHSFNALIKPILRDCLPNCFLVFPVQIDFQKCCEKIAGSLNEFCNRWCKREHVECDALKDWKLNIFKIIDRRISF